MVNGHRCYSSDLPQGGLEIPCVLNFTSIDEKDEKLLESALNTGISKMPANTSKPCEAKENINPISVVGDITEDHDAELPLAKKQRIDDFERIVMGEELSDIEINHAQQLFKVCHPKFSEFHSTLLQGRVKGSVNNIQIVHCSKRPTTTVNCKFGGICKQYPNCALLQKTNNNSKLQVWRGESF